ERDALDLWPGLPGVFHAAGPTNRGGAVRWREVDAAPRHRPRQGDCPTMETVMSETFSAYDSADYIHSDQDAVEYLMACMEEGGDDPAFLAHALGVVARARNMSELARDVGMSRSGLYKALDTDGNPTLATVVGVVKALGLRVGVARADAGGAA